MKQIKSAARIARQIRQTERSVDQTILEAGDLLAAMIEARREGRFAAGVGQAAFEDVARTIMTLTDARGAIVSGHGNLAKVASDHAIAWAPDGPLEEKEGPHLQVQERDAA